MMTARTLMVVLLFPFVVGPALHSQENPQSAADGQKHLHTSHMNSQTDTTTLDGLLAEVLSRNPRLQSSRTLARSAATRIPQAKAWDDPLIGVEFYATPISSLNPLKDGMETDYFVQQMIPFFGKRSLMAEAATARTRMVEQSATTTERNLITIVKKTYAMLYSVQRRLDVNVENQRLLNQIIESTRAKYSVGSNTQADVLKAQVELAKLKNEQTTLNQDLANAEAMMNALRAVPSHTQIGRVIDLIPKQFQGTLSDLYASALDYRPEVRGMGYEIEMNKADVAASQRERYPDIMVRGMYKSMMVGTDQWSAMIGINVPLAPWASAKYSEKIEENTLNVLASEQSLRDMQNMVQFEVRDAWSRIQSKWEQIDRYQRTILPQTDQALQSTLAAYQTDKVDFLSLLDSYRMLQEFRMEYYMAVGEYFSGLADLERAVGTNLTF
ncbi:MAG: TolC family protein [Ignavibacteria bacterium]|nr:TolC family protein [Ignavibacteria bacterium]